MSIPLAPIFEGGVPRRFGPSAPLFHRGDPVIRMFLVVQGQISLTRQTGAGAAIVLQQARSGQVVAEASDYSPLYHCDAKAVLATDLWTVSVELFRGRLTSDRALAEAWAEHLADAVQAARMRAEIRTLRTVAKRLDAWLGEGRKLPSKGSWQDLAAELGVRREVLYRKLARRRRDGT